MKNVCLNFKLQKMDKRIIVLALLAVIVWGLFLIAGERKTNPGIKHVVIIGVDGMSVQGTIEAQTPTFDEIKGNGAYSYQARNVFPTSSSPNWNAMLTSATASMTGVSSNEWRHDKYSLPPMLANENGWFPDVFYAIKKQEPTFKTAAVYHWSGFKNLYDPSFVDIDIDSKDERTTATDAVKVIKEEKPNFLFIQLDHVDHWGHTAGHMTPRYLQSVEKADSLAGEIITALKEAGIFETSLLIVNADHGGKGFGHGHETVEGNTVPYFFYGKEVKKTYEVSASVTHFDLAPLSLYALGLDVPEVWLGKSLESIFKGNKEPQNIMGAFLAPSMYVPEILPKSENGVSGGLFIDEKPKVQINAHSIEGSIFYTLDGSEPTAQSQKYSSPFELSTSCWMKAVFISENGGKSPMAEAFFRIASTEKKVGYKMYKGQGWDKLPDFKNEKLIESGMVHEFSSEELKEKINGHTGVVFTSNLIVKEEGEYSFYTRSDDGSKLYVDGQMVVDNDGGHGIQERAGNILLEEGIHKVEVHFFNGGGGFFLSTLVEGPGITKQVLSPEYLSLTE